MTDLIHFLNGRFVTEEELLISPRDLGYTRGYAVTDFLVTYNNRPFKLEKHIDRFFKSADLIGLSLPWSKDQIGTWVKETIDKNEVDFEKSIKIIASGGVTESMYPEKTPTLVIIISKRHKKSDSEYENGIKVKAIPYERPFPEAKTTHYIEAVKELTKLKDEGITDLIYYNDTQVFEGSGCSLFAVISDTLVTVKSGVLPGITREILLGILHLNIPIEVCNFTFDELQSASEIFVTGSNSEVRGVVELNGNPVGDGKVGTITKEVLKQYREYILQFLSQ